VKQKAFTIIEIMLVMIIIGILSIGIGSFYDYNSKTQRYKAETCMNNLNGELQGFMRTAFTSKALQS
jgi:prepilin-type N-terminal cleavage/methylation domain-containing protein